jgi:hypothetical protein
MTTSSNNSAPVSPVTDGLTCTRDVNGPLGRLMQSHQVRQADAFILLCDAVVASRRTMWEVSADYLVTGVL